ncbi:MAG: class II SORL domain-containing protein [Candidatus Omnitrophota bacterium]
MAELKDVLQSADWKAEKHVPVIETQEKVKKGEFFEIKLTVGKEIAHPNTTEHHIRFIAIYFLPDQEKFPYNIARCDFSAHGESVQGPNTSTIFSHSEFVCKFKTDKPGTILAISYCNIHGLWQNSKRIEVI